MPAFPLTESVLRESFREFVPPVPLKPAYRLGLLLVALATVLLPVVYVAFTVLVAYGVGYYASHGVRILHGGAILYRLLVYLGPLAAGGILFLFMVKPLFARPLRRLEPIVLEAASQPLLFAFVESVRLAVRAPAPAQVAVDANVNASAAFRRGLVSFFGRDLRLTIGMPLLAGLSLRQLAGVLAHEFGHFSQGSGMRLTYLVRSVNGWFARVVYERDAWDAEIHRLSRQVEFRIGLVLYLARAMVWVTRKFLWLLMMAGHAIGTFMLRQMELDADRYEARVAGSTHFRSTALRMRVLSVAAQRAIGVLSDSWIEKRLCDDHAGLVVALAEKMPEDLRKKIESIEQPASLFDTHPADAARIESAMAEGAAGIFHLEGPASDLVVDFPGVSRAVTSAFYRDVHGIEPKPENLMTLPHFLEGMEELDADMEHAGRYFHGLFGIMHPVELPQRLPEPLEAEAEALLVLSHSRGAIELGLQALEAERQAAAAKKTVPNHSPPPPNEQVVADLRRVMSERFLAALALLATPSARQRLADAEAMTQEVERCYPVYLALAGMSKKLDEAIVVHNEAAAQLQRLHAESSDAEKRRALDGLEAVARWTRRLLEALREVPYPFEHAQGAITLEKFAQANLPAAVALEWTVLPQCASLVQLLSAVHLRVLGRLAAVAERVETELCPPAAMPDASSATPLQH